jgi:hypothetical protein
VAELRRLFVTEEDSLFGPVHCLHNAAPDGLEANLLQLPPVEALIGCLCFFSLVRGLVPFMQLPAGREGGYPRLASHRRKMGPPWQMGILQTLFHGSFLRAGLFRYDVYSVTTALCRPALPQAPIRCLCPTSFLTSSATSSPRRGSPRTTAATVLHSGLKCLSGSSR